jgi:hypothetical protein
MKQEEAVDYFQRLHKKGEHLCILVWSTEDVIGQAQEHHIKITQAEADKIVEDMERHHDASFGVSWSTIDSYLDDLVTERLAKKKDEKAKEKIQID